MPDIGTNNATRHGLDHLPRVVTRLYLCAQPPARARMLATLTRPLGSLGLAAVASGAFWGFVVRRRGAGTDLGLGDVGQFTNGQVLELSRVVEQVDPGVFQQVASDIVASPAGVSAFGIALALLVLRRYFSGGGTHG